MQWTDFYDGFWDWSDSTRKSRISSLEDIGTGEEVVEVVLEIEDEKVRAQLIRKAMKFGVKFTNEDFMNLDGELTDELYEELGKYTKKTSGWCKTQRPLIVTPNIMDRYIPFMK